MWPLNKTVCSPALLTLTLNSPRLPTFFCSPNNGVFTLLDLPSQQWPAERTPVVTFERKPRWNRKSRFFMSHLTPTFLGWPPHCFHKPSELGKANHCTHLHKHTQTFSHQLLVSFQPGMPFATCFQRNTFYLPSESNIDTSMKSSLKLLIMPPSELSGNWFDLFLVIVTWSTMHYVIIFLPDSDNCLHQSLVLCLTPVAHNRCLSDGINLRPVTWVYSSTQILLKRKSRKKKKFYKWHIYMLILGPRPTF